MMVTTAKGRKAAGAGLFRWADCYCPRCRHTHRDLVASDGRRAKGAPR